jgi:SSS family solute:Na+ symporter
MSSFSAISVLFLTLFNPSFILFDSAELNIMGIGIGFGILGLLLGQVIEKYFPISKVEEV